MGLATTKEKESGGRCTIFLHHFSEDWDGGVDRVADDVDDGIWADLCNTATPASQYQYTARGEAGGPFGEGSDDASIDGEQVVTSHARLPWNASWDDHQVTTSECFEKVILCGFCVNHGSVGCLFRNLVVSCDASWG